MKLAKIQQPFTTKITFLPDQGFVWKSKVAHENYVQPPEYSSDFDFTGVNQTPLNITAVYVDDEQYYGASSIAMCRATEKSYFFEPSTQELYIHVEHTKRMDSSNFSANKIILICDNKVFYDENNNEVLPFLQTGFSIRESSDRYTIGKMALVNNSLDINNTLKKDNEPENELDFLIDDVIAGSDINVLYISNEDLENNKKTLTDIYTGYITKTRIGNDDISIQLEDKRGQLNAKFPTDQFSIDDYADISDKVDGSIIPIGYGDVYNAPGYCLNGETETGDVNYKYAMDGTTLSLVQVLKDDRWITVTPTTSDAEECTFTLSEALGRDDNGNPLDSRVIARLRDIDSPAAILLDILFRYTGLVFDLTNFDTSDWAEEAALLEDIYYYSNKKEELFKHIERLQTSSQLNFRFKVLPDGRYTLRVDDITRAIKEEIQAIDVISDNNEIETDFTDYATSINVSYKEDLQSGKQSEVFRDDYYDETYDKYKYDKNIEITSLLKTETLAIEKAQNALKEYKLARPKISFRLDCVSCLNLFDVVTVDLSEYDGITKTREYAGVRKLKVSDIQVDLDAEQTTIRGYDISDITSKGTEITTQGYLYGQYLYGTKLFGATTTTQPEVG